jgi:hypothetical protein
MVQSFPLVAFKGGNGAGRGGPAARDLAVRQVHVRRKKPQRTHTDTQKVWRQAISCSEVHFWTTVMWHFDSSSSLLVPVDGPKPRHWNALTEVERKQFKDKCRNALQDALCEPARPTRSACSARHGSTLGLITS